MSIRKQAGLLLGGTYGLICKVPLAGEPAVRGFCRAIGFLGNRVPGGMEWRGSMVELKQDLAEVFERLDIDFEAMNQDEESIELILTSCPYGFRSPEHALACDAAMDLDRTLFGYCGCDLTIEACLPHGDPVCRVLIRKKA